MFAIKRAFLKVKYQILTIYVLLQIYNKISIIASIEKS